jgi:hypothetical protein
MKHNILTPRKVEPINMPNVIDLSRLTPQQLKNLLANAERRNESDRAREVVNEMTRRGIATRREYRLLEWNQERVCEVMEPFKEVASEVPENQRTSYSEAGGLKARRPKDHPEKLWIQTYCAIKTKKINVTFHCEIKNPGDEPEFRITTGGETNQVYNADQLSFALDEWRSLAAMATSGETMRARPIEGEIDYPKLSREHIARYPKIRARLAE